MTKSVDTVTIREHFEALLKEMDLRYQQRFDAQQKALDAALLSAEKAVQTALLAAKEAVTKAEIAAEKRFDSTNEFREQLRDQAGTLMPRSEAENRMTALSEKIDVRVGSLSEKVEDLKIGAYSLQGRAAGRSDIWGYVIGGVALVAAIITIVAKL